MFLFDTNVVSELRVPARAHPRVLAWAKAQAATHVFLSSMTIYELEMGVLRLERKDPARGAVLRSWISDITCRHYPGRILAVDTDVVRVSATFQVPKSRPDRDTFIAATAVVHGMMVVTRNVGDFQIPGVKVFNPWTT